MSNSKYFDVWPVSTICGTVLKNRLLKLLQRAYIYRHLTHKWTWWLMWTWGCSAFFHQYMRIANALQFKDSWHRQIIFSSLRAFSKVVALSEISPVTVSLQQCNAENERIRQRNQKSETSDFATSRCKRKPNICHCKRRNTTRMYFGLTMSKARLLSRVYLTGYLTGYVTHN